MRRHEPHKKFTQLLARAPRSCKATECLFEWHQLVKYLRYQYYNFQCGLCVLRRGLLTASPEKWACWPLAECVISLNVHLEPQRVGCTEQVRRLPADSLLIRWQRNLWAPLQVQPPIHSICNSSSILSPSPFSLSLSWGLAHVFPFT